MYSMFDVYERACRMNGGAMFVITNCITFYEQVAQLSITSTRKLSIITIISVVFVLILSIVSELLICSNNIIYFYQSILSLVPPSVVSFDWTINSVTNFGGRVLKYQFMIELIGYAIATATTFVGIHKE